MNEQEREEIVAKLMRMAEEKVKVLRQQLREDKWNQLLDRYSLYRRDPVPMRAAELRLAALELEAADPAFSIQKLDAHLGNRLLIDSAAAA